MGDVSIAERGGVAYRELRSRSLLNRCDSSRVPFEWTVNPFRGCSMGCRYCYATYTHEFMGLTDPEDFHRVVYVKVGGLEETASQLAAIIRRGHTIALGTATDPYQPAENQYRITRRFLEAAAQCRGLRLGITTKGALILRDLPLLQKIATRSSLSVHLSLISTDADLLRRLEPWAPAPDVRIEVLRQVSAAGIETWLGLAPILPGITDRPADLDALLGSAAAAGVRYYHAGLVFLRSPTKEKFLAWLAREMPALRPAYEHAFASRAHLSEGTYRDKLLAVVERLASRHGLSRGGGRGGAPEEPHQLRLW